MPAPSFMIVGTPRSGTTLVQRLASELAGVGMPPETHFLSRFAQPLLARRRLPLGAAALREELAAYLRLPTSRGLALDPDDVLSRLGGTCDRLVDLFGAVVAALAGPAELYGEKTPEHLRWLGPLSRALPDLRVIAVVRDPRAVAASHAAVPWGVRPVQLLAEQWCIDVTLLRTAAHLLPDRLLALRYEDVVTDPDAARRRIAATLGVGLNSVGLNSIGLNSIGLNSEGTEQRPAGQPGIVLEWESWKHRALEPVTTEPVAAWRRSLTPDDADDVAARCREPMSAFGYGDLPSLDEARRRLAAWPGPLAEERAAFRRMKTRSQAAIDQISLS